MWQLTVDLLYETWPRRRGFDEWLLQQFKNAMNARDKSKPECRIWAQYYVSRVPVYSRVDEREHGISVLHRLLSNNDTVVLIAFGVCVTTDVPTSVPSEILRTQNLRVATATFNPRLWQYWTGKITQVERKTRARLTTLLIVGLCDDYFRTKPRHKGKPSAETLRFFAIARRLPLELQQVLARRLNGLGGTCALPKEIEWRRELISQ